MPATIEVFGGAIVAVGTFAPAIFTPDWLERHQLIGSDDAVAARSRDDFVLTQQVSQFQTDWFQLQVLQNQFVVANKGALAPTLRDLSAGVFSLLPELPITAIGLNFFAHYRFSDIAECHRLGDTLAPKDIWAEMYPLGDNQSIGLLDLTMAVLPHKRGDRQT